MQKINISAIPTVFTEAVVSKTDWKLEQCDILAYYISLALSPDYLKNIIK